MFCSPRGFLSLSNKKKISVRPQNLPFLHIYSVTALPALNSRESTTKLKHLDQLRILLICTVWSYSLHISVQAHAASFIKGEVA